MTNSRKRGWVRLYRQIEENPLYFLEPFTKAQAWIDMFLNANHKKGMINIRGNVVSIERGQIGWSESTMARRWMWSKNKVRRFLKLLETEQQIEQKKDRFITTIITIKNYNNFQNDTADDTAERQQTIQQTIHKQECKELNNDKNVKNVEKEYNYVAFEKATFTLWNSFCDKYPRLKKIQSITGTRRKCLKTRFSEISFKDFAAILKAAEEQPFLINGNPDSKEYKKWNVDFDWLIKNDTNYVKVLERKYKEIEVEGYKKYLKLKE